MASTSRNAARMLLSRSVHISCQAGGCTVACSSRTPLSVMDSACRLSTIGASRRSMHCSPRVHSAWPLGRDADPSNETPSELAAEADRTALPPSERAITIRDLSLLKEKQEPM